MSSNLGREVVGSSVFSQQDVTYFFNLYLQGRVGSSLIPRVQMTRFTSVEEFVLEIRKSAASVVADFRDVDIERLDDRRAQLMRTWLCQIVPSCVYRHRSDQFGQTSFYMCCFQDCGRPLSSQYALIRHYREQHYDRMPTGIFGTLVWFKCVACRVQFKRKKHLDKHYMSLNHISQMAMLGKLPSLAIFLFHYYVNP